jgi:hypothetical protein
MKSLIPQRQHFNGAELLSPKWTLRRGQKRATCEVWSHQFGFELRLTGRDPMPRTLVCVTQKDLIRVQEEWRAALEAKGWKA